MQHAKTGCNTPLQWHEEGESTPSLLYRGLSDRVWERTGWWCPADTCRRFVPDDQVEPFDPFAAPGAPS